MYALGAVEELREPHLVRLQLARTYWRELGIRIPLEFEDLLLLPLLMQAEVQRARRSL